jgi:hypothetical protein
LQQPEKRDSLFGPVGRKSEVGGGFTARGGGAQVYVFYKIFRKNGDANISDFNNLSNYGFEHDFTNIFTGQKYIRMISASLSSAPKK